MVSQMAANVVGCDVVGLAEGPEKCAFLQKHGCSEPFGLANYTQLRATKAVMRGFFVYNHLARWDQVMDDFAGWISDGRLKPLQDIEEGFAAMTRAVANLYYGANVGEQCCSVCGEPEEWV